MNDTDDHWSDSTTEHAWLCRWDDQQLIVRARTIEDARLKAREHAGPNKPVAARLATHNEQDGTEN